MKFTPAVFLIASFLISCGGDSKKAIQYYHKGNQEYLKNNLSAASQFYTMAIDLDKKLLNAHLMMAKISYYQKKSEKSIGHCETILTENADHVGALYWKARTIAVFSGKDKKNDDEAITMLKRAIELDNYHIRARSLLALLYEKKEKYKEAVYEYKMILQEQETLVNARANLGILYSRLGLKSRSIEEIEIAAEMAKLSGIPDSSIKLIKGELQK